MTIEVFIPAYNCRNTLSKTLASLAAQTDPDFYVCVVDDCNDEPLDHICDMFPQLNLRIIRNSENRGCGLSRQSAIDTSSADYLIPLDSDDMLLPMAVHVFKQEAVLHPDVDFFVSWVYNETPNSSGGTAYNIITNGYTLVSGKMYRAEFLRNYDIRNCNEFSRFADDTYINMLSYELGKTAMIPIPLYLYTHNLNSVTNTNGGRDYWADVVPKFLRCIEATCSIICRHKPADSIAHLENTLPYIRDVVTLRNQPQEILAYNALLESLQRMGRTKNLTQVGLEMQYDS